MTDTTMQLLLTVTALADQHVDVDKIQRKVNLGIVSDLGKGEANEAIADRAYHFFCSMVVPDFALDIFTMGSKHVVTISPAPAAVNPAPAA